MSCSRVVLFQFCVSSCPVFSLAFCGSVLDMEVLTLYTVAFHPRAWLVVDGVSFHLTSCAHSLKQRQGKSHLL